LCGDNIGRSVDGVGVTENSSKMIEKLELLCGDNIGRIVDGVGVTENSSNWNCCVAIVRLDTTGIIDGVGVTK
jgi:hypothetical protein